MSSKAMLITLCASSAMLCTSASLLRGGSSAQDSSSCGIISSPFAMQNGICCECSRGTDAGADLYYFRNSQDCSCCSTVDAKYKQDSSKPMPTSYCAHRGAEVLVNSLREQVATIVNNAVEVAFGDDKDEHGCISTAGYRYCAAEDKCLRAFEEGLGDEQAFQKRCTLLGPGGKAAVTA